jgi:UDP-GlcNAc3NAcA epimerase
LKEKPDWVLVYGDTNSTLAGALAAKKLHLKVAHVEAGLRSFNMKMPEEINRILTDRISDILFCPTETAMRNLEKEGYQNIDCKIRNVGDVMQDAALFYSCKAKKPETDLPVRFILCTIHRAENTDNSDSLKSIFDALEAITLELPIVFPIHPRTKNKLNAIGYNFDTSLIKFIEPVGYLEMVYLLQKCELVMTDSGGLQKEAYFFRKLCLTLRQETEWIELIENGYNYICGRKKDDIISLFHLLKDKSAFSLEKKLYGQGNAGIDIIKELITDLN